MLTCCVNLGELGSKVRLYLGQQSFSDNVRIFDASSYVAYDCLKPNIDIWTSSKIFVPREI